MQSICLLLVIISMASAGSIIGLFPFNSPSHHILGSALLKQLANRGHQVTMISPFSSEGSSSNYTDVQLHSVSEVDKGLVSKIANMQTNSEEQILAMVARKVIVEEAVLTDESFKAFLSKKPQCDLIIIIPVSVEALLAVGHYLGCPNVLFSPIGANTQMHNFNGNPLPASYVPNFLLDYSDRMNFFERLRNTIFGYYVDYKYDLRLQEQEDIRRKYFPDSPPIRDMLQDVDLILANTHFTMETPRPYLPNVIQIGGFNFKKNQKLPVDLQDFFDNSAHGVILFSLGSNLQGSTMNGEFLSSFLNSFKNSKYDFLWKFDSDITDLPKNVKIAKWLPQEAVLQHSKLKAFITHAGIGSVSEAVFYGVPMIAIPFFGEQIGNAARGKEYGYMISLDKDAVTEQRLSDAIKEITENPVYAKKVKQRSILLQEQDVDPMKKAMHWIELYMKLGRIEEIRSMAATLPWYQLNSVDIYAFILVVCFLVIIGIYFLLKRFIYYVMRIKKVKQL